MTKFMKIQAILLLGATLVQTSHAFAQESVLRRPAAQNKWNSMSDEQQSKAKSNGKNDWNKLDSSQKKTVAKAEKNRVKKLAKENY